VCRRCDVTLEPALLSVTAAVSDSSAAVLLLGSTAASSAVATYKQRASSATQGAADAAAAAAADGSGATLLLLLLPVLSLLDTELVGWWSIRLAVVATVPTALAAASLAKFCLRCCSASPTHSQLFRQVTNRAYSCCCCCGCCGCCCCYGGGCPAVLPRNAFNISSRALSAAGVRKDAPSRARHCSSDVSDSASFRLLARRLQQASSTGSHWLGLAAWLAATTAANSASLTPPAQQEQQH
jgi:hypothetical protein